MVTGVQVLDHREHEALKRAQDKDAGKGKNRRKPKKSFKGMTSEEYERYMAGATPKG
jgi:hypothetical protein